MASLKALRNRIHSITSTKKITKAMQMVAASKLRQTKVAMENSLPYYDNSLQILSALRSYDQDELPKLAQLIFTEQDNSKHLLVLVTSDRGLCGGFNNNLFRMTKKYLREHLDGKEYKFITIGKKAYDWVSYNYSDNAVLKNYTNFTTNKEFKEMFDFIKTELVNGNFNNLKVLYNHFKNTVSQTPTIKNILPHLTERKDDQTHIIECEGDNLLEAIANTYLYATMQFAIMQNGTGEQAARMVAMDNATKNAEDMTDKLTLQMNRQRQAAVTNELIEIISGAEAI